MIFFGSSDLNFRQSADCQKFPLLLLQLHSILFLQTLCFRIFRLYNMLPVARACRQRFDHSLSLPAENWTRFIETNLHVHCARSVIILEDSKMCGLFSPSTTNFPARTAFCIEMRGLTTLALLNVTHLERKCLPTQCLPTPVSDLFTIFCHEFLWCGLALEFLTWVHSFRHEMSCSSRVHGDSEFHPSVLQ